MAKKKGREIMPRNSTFDVSPLIETIRPHLDTIAVVLRQTLHRHEKLGHSGGKVSSLIEAEQALQAIRVAVDAATPPPAPPEEEAFVPERRK
jgi:hypothetical protein